MQFIACVFFLGGGRMFLPKVLLEVIFVGQIITSFSTVYAKKLDPLKKDVVSHNSQEQLINKNCIRLCSRPMSNSETCERLGDFSIGCINYKRCFEKCEQDIKLKKENIKQVKDKNSD